MTIAAIGTICKIVSGKLTVTAGPTGVQVSGRDLKAPPKGGVPILQQLETHFFVQGAVKDHREKNYTRKYTGINLNGGMSASANILRFVDAAGHDWSNTIVFNGAIDFNAFGGTRTAGAASYLYLLVDSTGKVGAAVNVPRWVKGISGTQLASQTLNFGIGVETVTQLGDSSMDSFVRALDNLEGYVAVCWIGKIGKYYARIYYVTPKKFDAGVYTEEPEVVLQAVAADDPSSGVYVVKEKGGEQVGLAFVETSLEEQEAVVEQGAGQHAGEGLAGQNDNSSLEYTVKLKPGTTVSAEDGVILEVRPTNSAGVSKEDFLAGLMIDGSVQAVEMILDETGAVTNPDTGNTLVQVDDETGEISAFIALDNTKDQWTITSASIPIDQPVLSISRASKFESLDEHNAALVGSDLVVKAVNLDSSATYELHTYMGKAKGDTDFQIDSVDAVKVVPENSTSCDFALTVPTEGQAVESGDYYITTALTKVTREDFNGDGAVTDDEVARVVLDTWESDSTIHYTNTNTPQAPGPVQLDASGNETLTFSFGEVTGAEGYRVQIYQNGEDTGYGYDFTVENNTLTCAGSTAAVTKEGGVYTVRIAPTVAGDALTNGESGAEALPEEEQPKVLQPGRRYAVGVSAYKNIQDEGAATNAGSEDDGIGENAQAMQKYPVFSAESRSDEVDIAPYEEAEFTVSVNGVELQRDEDTRIYEATVSDTSKELAVEVTSQGSYSILATAETDGEGAAFSLTSNNGTLRGNLGEFDGAAMYDIVVTNAATKDKTTAFLRVSKDDVPPVLVPDSDVYYAKADGSYSITGTTEAGATVNGVTADEDGRFAIAGSLMGTEQYGIVREKMISYVKPGEYTYSSQIDTEDAFNELTGKLEAEINDGKLSSYEIAPSTWQGASEYTVTGHRTDTWPAGTIANEQEFNDLVNGFEARLASGDIDSYSITPATWQGVRDYVATISEIETEAYHSLRYDGASDEANYASLEERQGRNDIKDLKLWWNEFEIDADQIAQFQADANSDYRTVEVKERPHLDSLKNVTLQAVDELGNKAEEVKVQATAHVHKLKEVPETPATCSHEGTKAHYVCTECGEKFADVTASLSPGDVSIPKLAPASLCVGNIKVDKTTIPLKTKQKLAKISAKLASGDRLVAAKSSNVKVAKVSVKGDKLVIVAGKKTGTATITAKSKLDSTVTFKVKVQKKKVVAKKIVGFKKKVTLKKGQSYQVPKDVSPVSVPDKLKFKSSKKKVAAVSGAGVVKAKKPGKATITVTVGKKKFKCKVTVK